MQVKSTQATLHYYHVISLIEERVLEYFIVCVPAFNCMFNQNEFDS